MGYSTNSITASTWTGGITYGAGLAMTAVTSSGAYFTVGNGNFVLLIANASSSDSATSGAVFIEPGSSKWAGSNGLAASTGSTVYSTATAPIAVGVPCHGVTGSSAIGSTTLSYVVVTSVELNKVKSTDERIYIVASTGSTKMYAAVLLTPNGSTQ